MNQLTPMYKIVHGLIDVDPSKLVNSGRETRRSTGQPRFRNIMQTKIVIDLLFPADCP